MIVKFLLISITWIVVVFNLMTKNQKLARQIMWPIVLIFAGSLANGIEIVARGSIFDYIDLTKIGISWPIFNLADTAIVIGLTWLIYRIIKLK